MTVSNGGTATLVFTGTNSYSGNVTITNGTAVLNTQDGASTYNGTVAFDAGSQGGGSLTLGPGVSLGTNTLSVPTGDIFSARPATGTTTYDGASTSTATSLTLQGGSFFDMTDGQTGTFSIRSNSATPLTIGTGGVGATLAFDLGSGGTYDQLTTNGAASVSGTNIVNLAIAGTSLTPGTYSLITASSGLNGTFQFVGGTSTNVTVGSEIYTLQLQSAATAVKVTVSNYQPRRPPRP